VDLAAIGNFPGKKFSLLHILAAGDDFIQVFIANFMFLILEYVGKASLVERIF
jgi:hypothetical protein